MSYDIKFVGSVKSAIFGGEGIFYARLTGPGTVWLQSLPFSRLAGRIHESAPQTGTKNIGEGSLIGANAFTEPDAGSDIASISTRAVPVNNGFRINGIKKQVNLLRVIKMILLNY